MCVPDEVAANSHGCTRHRCGRAHQGGGAPRLQTRPAGDRTAAPRLTGEGGVSTPYKRLSAPTTAGPALIRPVVLAPPKPTAFQHGAPRGSTSWCGAGRLGPSPYMRTENLLSPRPGGGHYPNAQGRGRWRRHGRPILTTRGAGRPGLLLPPDPAMVSLKPLAEPQAWQQQLSHVYSVTALQQGAPPCSYPPTSNGPRG